MPARKGEGHHNTRLTEIDVRLIHHDRGTVTEIAAKFGVSPSTVSQIKSGKRWSWLPRIRYRSRIRIRTRPAT